MELTSIRLFVTAAPAGRSADAHCPSLIHNPQFLRFSYSSNVTDIPCNPIRVFLFFHPETSPIFRNSSPEFPPAACLLNSYPPVSTRPSLCKNGVRVELALLVSTPGGSVPLQMVLRPRAPFHVVSNLKFQISN